MEGAVWADQYIFGEQSRPWGREIGRAKAKASSNEEGGMLRTKVGARDRAESTGHRAGAVNRRGRAPASTNQLRQGKIKVMEHRSGLLTSGQRSGGLDTTSGALAVRHSGRFPPASTAATAECDSG